MLCDDPEVFSLKSAVEYFIFQKSEKRQQASRKETMTI